MSLLRLSLVASLLFQDGAVRDLIARLDDDSIQERTEAAAELVRLGKAALPDLQNALDASSGERRERLAEVVRKIGERDRLSTLLRPAPRVTLDAADRPVREVLESVARQTGESLDLGRAPEGEKVTLSAKGLTFWEALDAVCRTSGRAMYEPDPRKGAAVKAGPYAPLPRRFSGPFAAFLESIEITSSGSFGQADRYDEMQLQVRVAWERGTHPSFVRISLLGLSDDTGADLRPAEDEAEAESRVPVTPEDRSAGTVIMTPRLPDAKAKTLARIRFDVECGFVLKYGGVTFKEPGTKGAEALECPQFSATLLSGNREENRFIARVKVESRDGAFQGPDREGFVLRLRDGRTPPGQVQGISSDGLSTTYDVVWEVGGKAEPVELSLRTPLEVHLERIPVEFRDVPLE